MKINEKLKENIYNLTNNKNAMHLILPWCNRVILVFLLALFIRRPVSTEESDEENWEVLEKHLVRPLRFLLSVKKIQIRKKLYMYRTFHFTLSKKLFVSNNIDANHNLKNKSLFVAPKHSYRKHKTTGNTQYHVLTSSEEVCNKEAQRKYHQMNFLCYALQYYHLQHHHTNYCLNVFV